MLALNHCSHYELWIFPIFSTPHPFYFANLIDLCRLFARYSLYSHFLTRLMTLNISSFSQSTESFYFKSLINLCNLSSFHYIFSLPIFDAYCFEPYQSSTLHKSYYYWWLYYQCTATSWGVPNVFLIMKSVVQAKIRPTDRRGSWKSEEGSLPVVVTSFSLCRIQKIYAYTLRFALWNSPLFCFHRNQFIFLLPDTSGQIWLPSVQQKCIASCALTLRSSGSPLFLVLAGRRNTWKRRSDVGNIRRLLLEGREDYASSCYSDRTREKCNGFPELQVRMSFLCRA